MLTRSYSTQFVLLHVFIIIHLVGCRTAVTDSVLGSTPGDLSEAQTQIPTLTPSKTEVPTHILNVTSTEIGSETSVPSATPTPTREPGVAQISTIDGMVMVYIPPGTFQMGSTEKDAGVDYDELPQHLVTLEGYWMDQTVVSNDMFSAFLNKNGNQIDGRTTWLDTGDEDVLIYHSDDVWWPLRGYENHPVIEVTWYGAQAYCQWVGRRLPSEAEWEYAAKGSSTDIDGGKIYPWGDDIDCEKAQYANCSGTLLPVNSKPLGASSYGVLGLSGNTWEWVADWYADDYYTTSPTENPLGPAEGETRTLRGGSWEYDWKHLRAANRRHNGPAVSMHDYSFRCSKDDKD